MTAKSVFFTSCLKKWPRRVYFYVILQKAMLWLNARACFSMQGRKQLATIVAHNCRLQEGQRWTCFSCLSWWASDGNYFYLCPIVRVQARTRYTSCEGMAMIAHHATIKLLYAVDCNDHSNELVSQEAMTRITFCCCSIAPHGWQQRGNTRSCLPTINMF